MPRQANSEASIAEQTRQALPLDTIVVGDCSAVLAGLPEKSVDLIFADPPYNLQLQNELLRPNLSVVDGVDDEWDRFVSFEEYDQFTLKWLSACKRVLKDDGTIWVIGSYHNIYRVGKIMMDLGYWVLNDVIWHKSNPMPNFRGTRFTNATETLIWAKKDKDQKRYTFNHHTMKNLNDEKQMTSVWEIPLCRGEERLVDRDGKKAHSTQKPEALLYRLIAASSRPGDVVLDPFVGSGTTAAVAKKLHRSFIGIEANEGYAALARRRVESVMVPLFDPAVLNTPTKRNAAQVNFSALLEAGIIGPGLRLHSKNRRNVAVVRADSAIESGQHAGSIHGVGAKVQNLPACNGWEYWHFEDESGALQPIDQLRIKYRSMHQLEVDDVR